MAGLVAVVVAIVSVVLPAVASADIVVADRAAFGGTGGLIRVDSTGARWTLSANSSPSGGPSFAAPSDVARAPNGDLLVADINAFGGAGGVIRVNPVTGARTVVSENANPSGGPSFVDPFGITLAANGDILVADQNAFGGGGGVIRVDPVTGARTTVSENANPSGGPSFDAPWGILTLPNGDIVVADAGAFSFAGGLIRVNPTTGVRTTLSTNGAPAGGPSLADPIQLALASNGDILVTDTSAFSGGGVIRVDPTTGARATVSANSSPAGSPTFSGTLGIRSDTNGDILVAGASSTGPDGAITRVNPVTGARATVSANALPAGGPSFTAPSGIAVVPDIWAPDTAITGGPAARTEDHTPTFSFASNELGPVFACSVDGAPLSACASPFTTKGLEPGRHSFQVAATDAAGNADASPARSDFRVLAGLADLPRPVLGRSVNVEPVSGKVLVKLPGKKKFVALREARHLPVRSLFNTRKGTVRIQTAAKKKGKRQAGNFSKGLFQLLQARKAKGLTELRLKGSSFKSCSARGGKRASASLNRRAIRRLRASAKGRFRTRGRYSAATVRGTIWTVTDRCDGTLTAVKRGTVAVRDFRRKKTVLVHKGKRYLAHARR
jgi:hypothetical protein